MFVLVAQAGEHLLVQSAQDTDAMVAAAAQCGVSLITVIHSRHDADMVIAKQAIDTRKFGRISLVKCDV